MALELLCHLFGVWGLHLPRHRPLDSVWDQAPRQGFHPGRLLNKPSPRPHPLHPPFGALAPCLAELLILQRAIPPRPRLIPAQSRSLCLSLWSALRSLRLLLWSLPLVLRLTWQLQLRPPLPLPNRRRLLGRASCMIPTAMRRTAREYPPFLPRWRPLPPPPPRLAARFGGPRAFVRLPSARVPGRSRARA